MHIPPRVQVIAFSLAFAAAIPACRSGGSGGEPAGQCGDGHLDPGEQCDEGNDVSGDGCEPGTCRFSCAVPASDCPAAPACRRAECDGAHRCASVADAALEGGDCGGGMTCRGGACVAGSCGNGTLESGEHCDDGNAANLDGCDSSCRYELVFRATALALQGAAAPASCTPPTNRLGAQALARTVVQSLNATMTDSVNAGTTNVLLRLLGLDDLTGAADATGVTVGVLGADLDPARGAWPGANPIDWWFLGDASTLAADGSPLETLANGALASRQLSAGPGEISLPLSLGGGPAVMRLRSARLWATLASSPAPDVPAPPPAALASGLSVVQTATAFGASQGLCGNVTVESLAQIPVPQEFAAGGATACSSACAGSRSYTSCGAGQPVGPGCNSLLDVLVGGCKVLACVVTLVTPQQPDVPAVAGGSVTTLTVGAGNKVPASQTAANLDAYSAYFKFDANRAHLTGRN